MPSRNIVRYDTGESYYHVYARGVSKQAIFHDEQDYYYFYGLLRRYLSKKEFKDKNGKPYRKFYDQLELLCFCLMPNHFHLLILQHSKGSIAHLIQGVMISYTRYYNNRYKRSGPLFESRYKASRISSQAYLEHISRYIHLNPKNWQAYPYSSLSSYADNRYDWLHPEKVLEMFSDYQTYIDFVADYEGNKQALELLKHELAD